MKLEAALRDLASHLESLNQRFAVVGGLAASVHGEARFTRDIDVAIAVDDDQQAEELIFALKSRGYTVVATVEQEAVGRMATARLKSPSGIVCDLVFSTCGFEGEVVATCQAIEVFEGLTLPTARAESLLAMKVLSAAENRPRDLEDIRAILRESPDIDESTLLDLLEKTTTRGYARGQDLGEKWRALRARLTS